MNNRDERRLIFPTWPSLSERRARAHAVSNVEIHASLKLDNKEKSYFSGRAQIHLDLKDRKSSGLKINYTGRVLKVFSFHPNGQLCVLKVKRSAQGFTVQLGKQEDSRAVSIVVDFVSKYSAAGLARFVDPFDQSVYYRTNANPFYLSNVLPCIDQPEIKCTFNVDVMTHKENVCRFSTMLKRTEMKGSFRKFYFQRSVPFLTAQFVLIAGPYAIWKEKTVEPRSRRPLLLYALRSLVQTPQLGDLGFVVTDPRDSLGR